jgi:hypothetical protein
MINFHIPGIVNHLDLNIKLIELIKSNPEYFYDGVNVSGIYGSFYCPWNGGRSNGNNFLSKQEKEEIVKRLNKLGVGVLFTFTNSMVEQRDLYDMYANEDIAIAATNPLNKIIVTSDLLKTYIHEKHKDIKFISSITSSKNNQNDEEYEICVVNANMNHTEELFKIKDKSRIEILVNSNCVRNCPYEQKHYENISLMNLLRVSEIFQCPFETETVNDLESMKTMDLFITVEDLYDKYVPAGFNIFKVNGRHVKDNTVLDYYLYYMVKPEYKETVRDLLKEE